MKSAMISAVVTAALVAGASPANASNNEPMRKIAPISDDSASGVLWMERRGSTSRGRGVRESREYLLADSWEYLGYAHVVVLHRQYNCAEGTTRLLDTAFHYDGLTPVWTEAATAAEAQWGRPKSDWEHRAFDYVCRGAWVQGETKPKRALIEDFLEDNRPAD